MPASVAAVLRAPNAGLSTFLGAPWVHAAHRPNAAGPVASGPFGSLLFGAELVDDSVVVVSSDSVVVVSSAEVVVVPSAEVVVSSSGWPRCRPGLSGTSNGVASCTATETTCCTGPGSVPVTAPVAAVAAARPAPRAILPASERPAMNWGTDIRFLRFDVAGACPAGPDSMEMPVAHIACNAGDAVTTVSAATLRTSTTNDARSVKSACGGSPARIASASWSVIKR